MATTYNRIQTGTSRAFVAAWALAAGENGDAAPFAQFADKSVQVFGNFGGASVVVEGSNDGATWAPLSDPHGNPLSILTAKVVQVSEATAYVRPRISGGDGTTALSIYILLRE